MLEGFKSVHAFYFISNTFISNTENKIGYPENWLKIPILGRLGQFSGYSMYFQLKILEIHLKSYT